MLVQEAERLRSMGGGLYFCNNRKAVSESLSKANVIQEIGPENFFAEKKDAIAAIFTKLDAKICEQCSARIFFECNLERPNPNTETPKAVGTAPA